MKTNIKRITSALLALALLLGLAGCGKDGQQKTAELVFQTSPYYIQEDVPTAAGAGQLVDCCTDGSAVWYLSLPEEDAEPVLCRVPLDGGASELLPDFQPSTEGELSMRNWWGPVLGGDGKLWLWERTAVAEESDVKTEDGYLKKFRDVYRVRQLDPETGKELSARDITAAMETMDYLSLSGFVVDGAGTVFLADKDQVAAVGGQGEVLYSLKAKRYTTVASSGAGGTLALLADGTVGVLIQLPEDVREVRSIDPETRDWSGETYSIHNGVGEIYSGRGRCAFYYINSNTVFGMVPGEEVPLRLLSWTDAQLDEPSAVRCFALLEEGQAAVFSDIHEPGTDQYADRLQVTKLLPTDEPPPGSRTKLIYGTIGYNDTNYMIVDRAVKFNRASTEYQIVIRDYAEGMLNGGIRDSTVYYNALSRLYADMALGQGPDILDGTIPLDALARQGGLEDLWTWIDSDPEISREGLMDHVLECMEVDGMLPRVCSGFAIETAVASAEAAGDRTGWTMEEMLDAFGGEMPEVYFAGIFDEMLTYARFNRIDRASTLYNLVNTNLERYIDWETGECSFDSEDFKALLQIVNSMGDAVSDLNLSNPYVNGELARPSTAEVVEPCVVYPWEGRPVLYTRRLAKPMDLVVDDVLFGGRDSLTDYEQRLWDAGILYLNTYPNGVERGETIYEDDFPQRDWWDNGYRNARNLSEKVAADCVTGGADGKVYASYVGLPSASGTGSSFTVYDCMGISSASEEKEGAWTFVRSLLLPGGNSVDWAQTLTGAAVPPAVNGFSMDRATFEEQLARKDWTDPYSGEVFRDADGEAVEFAAEAVAVGRPGDIVMVAYLFSPTQAQMDRFWKLYEATDHITGKDDALVEIILEQAEAYFAGDKGLDETADLIQRRVKLYVSEQQ